MPLNPFDETLEELDREQQAAPANPFLETLAEMDGDAETQLRGALTAAQGTTPDRRADALRLADRTGLPVDVIERNFEAIQKRATIADTPYARMLKESPALAEWVQEPDHAAIAQDDLAPLGALEWLMTAPARAFSQGVNQVRFARLKTESMFRPLSQEEEDLLNSYRFHMDLGGELGASGSWWRSAVVGAEQLLPNIGAGAAMAATYGVAGAVMTGAIGAAGGSVVPGGGTLAGGLAGAGIGFRAGALYGGAKFGFQLEAGLALDEYEAFRDETGRPLDPDVARAAALATGVMNAGLEAYGLTKLAQSIPGVNKLTGAALRKGVTEALKRPTVRASLAAAMRNYAGTLTAETATEVAQRAATILSGEVAKIASGQDIEAKTGSEVFADLISEGVGAIQSFGLVSLPGPTLQLAHARRQAQAAEQRVDFFRAVGEGVAASKAAQRAPAAVESLIARAVAHGPAPAVYAPVDTWATYWQEKGQDPAEVAKEVTGDTRAYEEAQQTGLLKIPTEKYAVRLAPTEHNEFLSNELKLAPEEMNAREAAEFQEAEVARAQQQQADAQASLVQQIEQQIAQRIEGAGVPTSTAAPLAQLMTRGFALAESVGVDPTPLFERYNIQVRRPASTEEAPAARPATEPAATPEDAGTVPLEAEGATPAEGAAAAGDEDLRPPVQRIRPAVSPLMIELARKTVEDAAAQRGTPADVPGNPVAQDLERERQAALEAWRQMQVDEAPAIEDTAADGDGSEAGLGRANDRGELAPADERGGDEGSGDGGRAERRRLPTTLELTDLRDYPNGFTRAAPDTDAARLTDEVRRELERIVEELDNFPFVERTWNWLTDENGKFGNAAGGDAEIVGGAPGAPVYDDILNYAPLNKGKGRPLANTVSATRSKVEADVRKVLETGIIHNNIAEGAVRVAERRAIDDYRDLSRPMLPPRWGMEATPEMLEEISDAIDDALLDADTSFDPSEFDQSMRGLFDEVLEPEVDTLDTGEQQPRLPGAGEVRDQNIQTPEFEAPFSLTSEVIQRKGKQTTLFQEAPAAEGPPNAEGHYAVFIGWQETGDPATPAIPLYNVYGGPRDRSTVSTTELEQLGIPIPPTPPRQEFTQAADRGRRGSIQIGPDRSITINLFAQADLSTFLHETGHFYLELLGDLVEAVTATPEGERTDPQRRLLADWQTLLGQLGAEGRDRLTREHHERFARMFEAYLMEGRAPSIGLQEIFSRFRAWLLGVYRSLKALNANLTPEVRGVFDRMLATDEEIAAAEARGRFEALFTTPEAAGMSPDEFTLYRETVARASRAAREQLEAKLLGEVRREQTAEWKRRREEIREVVAGELYARPIYAALAAMRFGTHPDGSPLLEGMQVPPLKLSRQAIVDRYGEDRLRRLPRPFIYTRVGGVDPELVAERFGFSSGDELLAAVETTEPLEAAIKRETDRRMLAEHGSMLLDGSVFDEAQAAAANDVRDEVLRAELRALWKLAQQVDPFVRRERRAGQSALRAERRERDYERRWLEAEAKLRIAIAEGRKQAEIDALQAEVRDLKAQIRGGAAAIRRGIPDAATVQATARARIARTRVQDLNPALYWSASRRAATKALEHAARAEYDDAILAKTEELLYVNLYREAERAKSDVDTRVRQARDLAKPKTQARLGLAGGTYREQILGILDRYNFAKVSAKDLEKRARMRDWLEALEAQGLPADPADFPPEVVDDLRRADYQTLTYEELVGVTDGLAQILHLARLRNRQLKTEKGEAFSAIRDALVASIREHNRETALPVEFDRTADRKHRIALAYAAHLKMGTIARMFDGGRDGGAMWEHIIRPLNAATDLEQQRRTEEAQGLRDLYARFYPGRALGRLKDKVYIPAIGASLSKEARLAVALTRGNEDGLARLTADPTRRWTKAGVDAIVATLDANDLAFVNAAWAHIDRLWPEIAAKQERVTGLAPEKVEATPFTVPAADGVEVEMTGGYYPLLYDQRLTGRAQRNADVTEAKIATAAAYVSSTTRRGHTKARVQHVKLSVRLDLGVLTQHVDQVLHDLTHHETLIDVARLLRDQKVVDAIYATRGSAFYRQLTRGLSAVAVGTAPETDADKAATFMRTGAQIAGLGFNLWTGAQQPLGLFNGMERVGARWVARGMRRWLSDAASMQNTLEWITANSRFMADRHRNATQDLAQLREQFSAAGGWFDSLLREWTDDRLTKQHLVDSFLWHIGIMQRVADVPTWLGAYEKAMADPANEGDEARAVALADQAVTDSQGSGRIVDLADIQRGSGLAKLWLTFYSYGSTTINRAAAIADRGARTPNTITTMLGHYLLLYVMPAAGTIALANLFGRRDDDDAESWLVAVAGETLSGVMNGVMFLRDVGPAAVSKFLGLDSAIRGYDGPAGARLLQTIDRVTTQVAQGEADDALLRAINAAAGILFRYPAGQVQRTIDGWIALQDGTTKNPAALLFGPPRED